MLPNTSLSTSKPRFFFTPKRDRRACSFLGGKAEVNEVTDENHRGVSYNTRDKPATQHLFHLLPMPGSVGLQGLLLLLTVLSRHLHEALPLSEPLQLPLELVPDSRDAPFRLV